MRGLAAIILLYGLVARASADDAAPDNAPANAPDATRHALLVACSEYPLKQSLKSRPLPGTANDAEIFEGLLRTRFGFRDVTKLVGWPEDETARPAKANISQAFESLIARVQPGSQVVIVMSGHGTQVDLPAAQQDRLDPENPEPDGLDEAFVPADFTRGSDLIRDNQFGRWLDRMKAKGAHVWIIFDCCFSGTMSRGPADEPIRGAHPRALGLADQNRRDVFEPHPIGVRAAAQPDSAGGSVVAFYASQSFETAKEVYRPGSAEKIDAHRHGLLSYHLTQLLAQRTETLTYGDFARSLVGRIRADMGARAPTPAFEGDLDREVLGVRRWPDANPLYLRRKGDSSSLDAGVLAGAARGTVLAVYAPDDQEKKRALGHVRVVEATAVSARVESVTLAEETTPTPLTEFPDLSRCRIVSRELSDSALTVTVHGANEEGVLAVRRGLENSVGETARLVAELEQADWRIAVDARNVSLYQRKEPADADPAQAGPEEARRVYARYSVESIDAAVERLAEDLRKIYTWETLWRIAPEYSFDEGRRGRRQLKLEIETLLRDTDSTGELLKASHLRPGDALLASVVNDGYLTRGQMNYAVLFLGPRFEIEFIRADSIRGRETYEKPIREPVDKMRIGDVEGKAGYVVIATPTKGHPHRLQYQFLRQDPVGSPAKRGALPLPQNATPFEQLLAAATRGKPLLRSSESPEEPAVSSWSWTIVGNDRNNP